MAAETNVFVGISLRNKKLTPRSVVRIATEAEAQFSARRLVFLLADDLELLNLRAFESGTNSSLLKKTANRRSQIENTIETGFRESDYPRVASSIARWNEILNQYYWNCYFELFATFVANKRLRTDIDRVVGHFIKRRTAPVDESRRLFLAQYILSELPALLRGVTLNSQRYHSMIYPSAADGGIDRIADDLARGRYGRADAFARKCRVHKVPITTTS